MKNEIHGFYIDMLRICFEANNLELLNHIATLGIGERFDMCEYYLLRIEGKYFEYVYQIRYDELGKDNLFGELRFGLNGSDEDSNIHTNGKRKAWISVDNRVLYNDEIHYLEYISDMLGLEFHNITSLDLCLDMTMDIGKYLKRLIRCKDLEVILNGTKIQDRKQDRPEIIYTYSGNLDRVKYLTLNIKQRKAIKDKSRGLCLVAYNKKAEIENSSSKNYIADTYGDPKKLYRLEVHLNNDELKDYFKNDKHELNLGLIFNEKKLFGLFYHTLERLIRFKRNGKKVEWWDVLSGDITTTPTKGEKKKEKILKSAS